jgi:hypothetical protein
MGLHMMDISQIGRSTVNTAIVNIKKAGDAGRPGKECRAAIFHLRGAVRFSGAEILTRALTRYLGEADPQDPSSGAYADACAVVLSFREVFSLNRVARRILHEDITRLLSDDRSVVVIDPNDNLRWESESKEVQPVVVKSQEEAREFIGGPGCSATIQEDW